MGDGFVHANSEMIRCNWGINDYRSFMELPDSEKKSKTICTKNGTDKTEKGVTLEFQNVCFRYPGAEHDVIHNLNLKVRAGENIALVGVNGAGKTTLLNILSNYDKNYTGVISIDGEKMNKVDYLDMPVAYLVIECGVV